MVFALGCLVFAQFVFAQNKIKELNIKLSVYAGASDEIKQKFESANFFILKRNPVDLLKEIKLEESITQNLSKKREKISDDLYLKAASLILIETDRTRPLISYVTDWDYSNTDKEIDEDLEILSFVINEKFKKNLISEIKFDSLSPDYILRIPNQKIYLFGFCRVGKNILVWSRSISEKEREMELDQYNAEFIFSREEFDKEINKKTRERERKERMWLF